ncbi:MAG: tetratricopeptide repeat protein [Acidobacteriota bacterium]
MIPSPEQVHDIIQQTEGDLSAVPFAVLLHASAVAKRTAYLDILRGPLKKSIVFVDGAPVDCESNLLHETIGRVLVARQALSEEQYQSLLAKSVNDGLSFADVVMRDGVISASELYKLMQGNLAKKLLDGFSWSDGRFQVREEPVPKTNSSLHIKVPQLVITGVAKFSAQDEVNLAVSELVGKQLVLHPEPPYALDDLRLSIDQRRVLEMVKQGKRLDELAAEMTIPFDDITRLLYALAMLGIIVPLRWLPHELRKQAAPRKKRPVTTGVIVIPPGGGAAQPPESVAPSADAPDATLASPKRTYNVDAMRERLTVAYEGHRKKDAFELLGIVDESASQEDIEHAYLTFSRTFAPWRYEEAGLTELVEQAEDMFIAGGQAFGDLCDAERRNQLVVQRRNRRAQRHVQADPNQFAIQSELLDSETQFKRGIELTRAGNYREALEQLQFAHDFDPQNPLYRAELAYTRFMNDRGALNHSVRELREAIRIDKRCGIAYFYLGKLYTELSRYDEAEKALRKAMKILSPDRRPIEALKEMAARRKSRR